MSGLLIDICNRHLMCPPALQQPSSTPTQLSPELAVVHARRPSVSTGPPVVSTALPLVRSDHSQLSPELAVVHARCPSVSTGPPAVSMPLPSDRSDVSYASIVHGSHPPTITSINLPDEPPTLLS